MGREAWLGPPCQTDPSFQEATPRLAGRHPATLLRALRRHLPTPRAPPCVLGDLLARISAQSGAGTSQVVLHSEPGTVCKLHEEGNVRQQQEERVAGASGTRKAVTTAASEEAVL